MTKSSRSASSTSSIKARKETKATKKAKPTNAAPSNQSAASAQADTTEDVNTKLARIQAMVKKASCFIPLSLASQCGHERVLYYNANAPADELYECAIDRLRAVLRLLESLYEYDKCEADALYAVSSVSALLMNDALCLLEEFNPVAVKLRGFNKLP